MSQARPDLAIAGGEFMQHFLPPVIQPNVFMPTELSSAKCIAAPSQMYCVYKCIAARLKCIVCTNVLQPRLALNESLAQPPC